MTQKSLGPAVVASTARARNDQLGGSINPKNNKCPENTQAPKIGGRNSRRKGNIREREARDKHLAIGIFAERVPLSGSTGFQGKKHDLDIYAFGKDEAPLVCEVKARRRGKGFAVLEKWLGAHDALFLRRNNADLMVVLPWRVWARLLERVRR